MNKGLPWTKIKKEYLEGVKPCILAKKYKTTSNTIRSRASKENWAEEKHTISNKVQQKVEERINGLTNKAFNALEQVLDDKAAKYQEKVAAAKAILDVSGLKKDKHEVKNLTPQIVVADESHKNILEQIRNADTN